ncbi:cysteine proteinase [Athelia psychrophila]|uniref:ubiquitinyl hydrolase 1 n=1 Tax=Athelia psychrophila TaxID=1759441 RepID=A0A166DG46_9AGAM|nr:cysteine proteinase [Fibularhizoctonia sp. CBS 109695]
MAKPKAPTQAEIFKAKEDAERELCLPPGLINHGNTCFMNSTLQGLIATRYLKDLIQSTPLPNSAQKSTPLFIASRRSPLLADTIARRCEKTEKNGVKDNRKGDSIGDVFISIMDKAWVLQQEKRRMSMSPKLLLTSLGQKYDQYLDFRQQDAHEFLRQLLDAMRMEEIDIIKVRQPKGKRPLRRRSTIPAGIYLPQNPSPLAAVMTHSLTSSTAGDDDEKLIPFVDMLFGGRLTSILVCQECKHISRTYEDFNDLSLSIKPEDYTKERKRDRLKNFAKKFKLQTSGTDALRSSSVPASPRKSVGDSYPHEPPAEEPRRKSVDIPDSVAHEALSPQTSAESGGDADTSMNTDETHMGPSEQRAESKDNMEPAINPETEQGEERDHVGFVEPLKPERMLKDDGWAKLGRKISLSVRPKDKSGPRRSLSRGRQPDITKSRMSLDNVASSSFNSTPRTPSDPLIAPVPSIPPNLGPPVARSVSLSPALLSKANTSPSIPPISPPLSALKFPRRSRASSPTIAGSSKKPRPTPPPKPSPEEAAYLRQILADVIPASNPLAIFKPPGLASTSTSTIATQFFMKMDQPPGIEECLRMFTAVEVLDGENMVGCRRCWKVTNGLYKPRKNLEESDDTDESEGEAHDTKTPIQDATTPTAARTEIVVEAPSPPSSPSASASSSTTSLDVQSDSAPYDTPQSSLSKETSLTRKVSPSPKYGVISIPTISTTAPAIPIISTTAPEPAATPDTPDSKSSPQTPVVFKDHNGLAEVLAAPLPIRDSLRAPRMSKHKRIPGYTDSADESSDDEAGSDASGCTSVFSETSSLASQSVNASLEQLQPPVKSAKRTPAALKVPPKVSRPRQVTMRPAYKRYLIATPPPVLVIHLKRFQQVSKSPMVSFSSGFKKLDDYVAFPETLDLTPFLAPKREDFGLGRGGKIKFKPKKARDCMYRLYAVVVHIGHMLGGHYIAYTALPTAAPEGVPDATPEITSRSNTSMGHVESAAPRKWAYISDTVVRLASLDEVLKAKAYLCLYERV